MKIKLYPSILIIILFFFFTFFYLHKRSFVKNNFKKIPSSEKEFLNNFFQYTVRLSSFGYVLFGDKPMSIETYNNVNPSKSIEGFDYMDDEHFVAKYRLKEGWLVWKKYESLFPLKNFTMISYMSPENSNFKEICLINNWTFLKIVKDNLKDFQTVLQTNSSAEQIFEDYVNMGPYFNIIRRHDGLFGILLGYGKDNSWAFYKQKNLEIRTLSFFNAPHDQDNKVILLPMFMILSGTEESQLLRRKYIQQQKIIELHYSSKHYAQVSLEQLTK